MTPEDLAKASLPKDPEPLVMEFNPTDAGRNYKVITEWVVWKRQSRSLGQSAEYILGECEGNGIRTSAVMQAQKGAFGYGSFIKTFSGSLYILKGDPIQGEYPEGQAGL